jgi:hypothetical protein
MLQASRTRIENSVIPPPLPTFDIEPGHAPGFLLVGVRYRPTADSRPVAVATRETMLEGVKISRLAIEALVIVISILVALLMLLYASTCKGPIV